MTFEVPLPAMSMAELLERQTKVADFNDLAAVIYDAQRGFTIDGQLAMLAALKRIEDRLSALEGMGRGLNEIARRGT